MATLLLAAIEKSEVDPNPESPRCTCPDFETHRPCCKPSFAVEYTLEREPSVTQTADGDTTTTTVTESVKVTKRVTYKQDWRAYNTAQTNEKHLFQSLLHELGNLVVEPPQDMSRPSLMYRDRLFAAAFKVYCGTSARRFQLSLTKHR